MVIQQFIKRHLAEYVAVRRSANDPVPSATVRLLERATTCGDPSNGSANVGCPRCGYEQEVFFSCKVPVFCTRCARRRIKERIEHLLKSVLANVPVRHWVFNLPAQLRFRLIYYRKIRAGLLHKCVRSVITYLRRKAREVLDLESVRVVFPAALSFTHLSSGNLKTNVHFHFVVPAGVWVRLERNGPVTFHELPPPTEDELADIASRVCRSVRKLLIKEGYWQDVLIKSQPDTVQGILTLGQRQRVTFFGAAAVPGGARRRGAQPFEIHVNNHIERGDHDTLQRLLEYLLSPPLTDDQLELLPDGNMRLRFPRPRLDGMDEETMHPHELLRRMIPIVPTPRSRQYEYHGAFGPRSSIRKHIVKQIKFLPRCETPRGLDQSPAGQRARIALHQRTHYEDVSRCPECGERLELVLLTTWRSTYKNQAWIKPDHPLAPAA